MLRKNLFVIALLGVLIYSCDRDDNVEDNFDHAAQAIIDNDSLVDYLQTHYFDDAIDSIKPLGKGATALIDDPRLMVKNITEFDVDYKLYYLVLREGNPIPKKNNPTIMDSVLVRYRGDYLRTTDELVFFEQRISPIWLTLNSTIRGWTHTFIEFKGGENVTSNGPIEFAGGGKGVIFIPSGLAYRNFGTTGIPANTNLQFYFDLFDVVEGTDHDNDGVASFYEDADGDGDHFNDDTDGDFLANFLDNDDDGDGTPTIEEDANGDGDPRNDDTDGDGIPDYLDPDNS